MGSFLSVRVTREEHLPRTDSHISEKYFISASLFLSFNTWRMKKRENETISMARPFLRRPTVHGIRQMRSWFAWERSGFSNYVYHIEHSPGCLDVRRFHHLFPSLLFPRLCGGGGARPPTGQLAVSGEEFSTHIARLLTNSPDVRARKPGCNYNTDIPATHTYTHTHKHTVSLQLS